MNIPATHFKLLRLAILRSLPIEQTGPDVFRVGSHSHPAHWHTVNPVEQSCCCPAFGWCCHLSLALDRWMEREAPLQERGDYLEARRLDFGGMPARELGRDDRRYYAACVEKARRLYAPLLVTPDRESVSF